MNPYTRYGATLSIIISSQIQPNPVEPAGSNPPSNYVFTKLISAPLRTAILLGPGFCLSPQPE